jgi:hypothetical protein
VQQQCRFKTTVRNVTNVSLRGAPSVASIRPERPRARRHTVTSPLGRQAAAAAAIAMVACEAAHNLQAGAAYFQGRIYLVSTSPTMQPYASTRTLRSSIALLLTLQGTRTSIGRRAAPTMLEFSTSSRSFS